MSSFDEKDDFDRRSFTRRMVPKVLVRHLDEEKDRIFRGMQKRKRRETEGKNGPWAESAEDWMVRQVYQVVRQLIRLGHVEIVAQAIDKSGGRRKGRYDIEDQPFKLALFFIFGSSMVPTIRSPLSRNRRHLLGDALAYADRHNVPSKYLNGFIKQAGLKQCRKKLEDPLHREPGFKLDRGRKS